MTDDFFHNGWTYPARWPSMPVFAFDEAPTAAPAPASTPAAVSGAPDGGTPSTPSTPSAGVTEVPDSPASDPFSGLDGDFGGDDVIEIPADPSTVDGAQAPGATAVPPAQATPAAAPQAPPQGEPAPAAAVPPSTVTAPATPLDQLSATIEGFKTNGKELSAHAAQHLFKLSEEDATALATNAEEVIPRLMGQVYNQAIVAAANLIRTFVPQIVEHGAAQVATKAEKSREAINEFYQANPDLNEKDHAADVAKWAKVFRTANPTAPRKEAIAFVANAIRAERGLAPAPKGAPPAARQAAFAPARQGGHQPPPVQEHDPYAGLGMELDS